MHMVTQKCDLDIILSTARLTGALKPNLDLMPAATVKTKLMAKV